MGKHIVEVVKFTTEVEDVYPPEFENVSHFETLKDWLYHICDTDQPEKPVATYCIGMFESQDDYSVFLVGRNKFDIDQYRSVDKIDFTPQNMHYQLPKTEFGNLTLEQVRERLITQLKAFVMTEKFKNSFFITADALIVRFNGEIIWSK